VKLGAKPQKSLTSMSWRQALLQDFLPWKEGSVSSVHPDDNDQSAEQLWTAESFA
jgi:hypothetical protein